MGKKSVRRRLLAGIEQMNRHAAEGNLAAARSVLGALRGLVNHGDPNAASRLTTVLDVHEARITELEEQQELHRRNDARDRPSGTLDSAGRPDNAVCRLCLSPFHRDDDKVVVCDICRPPQRRSVRTVSGGLPTHGRRR